VRAERVVLRIGTDGTVSSVHNEALGLRALGRMTARRASNVEWDDDRQQWGVTLANGEVLGHWNDRSEAIKAEVEHLNNAIQDGTIKGIMA
jgi:hypothetical protein